MGVASDCKPDPSRVDNSGLAFKGSHLQMQLYANSESHTLEQEVVRIGIVPEGATLRWISPLEIDHYTEYRDIKFLERLSLQEHTSQLRDFWPSGGPCWDGLARWWVDDRSGVLLFEAKSYPEETNSRMMARAESSIRRIADALGETAEWLGLKATPRSWFSGFYQTANRLAHLYFLRELCGVDADLVFLLVVDDPTHRRTAPGAWETAWSEMWGRMGLDGPPPSTHALVLPGLERPEASGKSPVT